MKKGKASNFLVIWENRGEMIDLVLTLLTTYPNRNRKKCHIGRENTIFLKMCRIIVKIDFLLGHKITVNSFPRRIITQVTFTNWNQMKLKIKTEA